MSPSCGCRDCRRENRQPKRLCPAPRHWVSSDLAQTALAPGDSLGSFRLASGAFLRPAPHLKPSPGAVLALPCLPHRHGHAPGPSLRKPPLAPCAAVGHLVLPVGPFLGPSTHIKRALRAVLA